MIEFTYPLLLFVGFIIGYLSKGITVNVNHQLVSEENDVVEESYNQSIPDPEYQEWFDKNK